MSEVMKICAALILGFIIAAVSGRFIIPLLRKFQLGQHVRGDGPQTHLAKAGTPSFGGFIFLGSFFVLSIIYLILDYNPTVLMITLFVLAHAIIGFVDDYFNIKVNNDGLGDGQKALLLLIVQMIFVFIFVYGSNNPITIAMPFGWNAIQVEGAWKFVYALFLIFYFFACTNAVNIVDGIDGLASSVTIVTLIFTAITGYITYKANSNPGSMALTLISTVMIGALFGFLIYNWHTAKCFMGDMGSLALGALVSAIFLYLDMPWAFIFAGIIYVIDIATVLLQTAYFKATGGKRIFRMTPIHHAFELRGWKEEKVVLSFTAVQLIGAVLAALMIWPFV